MNTVIAIMIPFVIVLWLGWVSLQVCDLMEEIGKIYNHLAVIFNQMNEHGKQLDELRGRFDDDGR